MPDDYLTDLKHEFNHLKAVKEYALLYPDYQVLEWIQKLERMINGRVAFVKAVYGSENKVYQDLLGVKDQAEAYQPEMQSISWRYSGYEFFTS